MLKKSITITAILMVAVLFTFGFIQINGDPNADKAPVVKTENGNGQTDTIPPAGFPYPTVFNYNYSAIAPQNAGSVGALWVNGKYYLNRWNLTDCYIYSDNGPGGGPGTLLSTTPYVGSCRDLSTDGFWVYAGNSASSVFRLDPTTLATVKTFNIPGANARGVAWDPNRHGFWTTAFSGNITCYDTNGVLVQTITSALIGKYGLSFDSTSVPGQAFVWAWDQTSTTTAGLYKYSCATGALLNTYIFTLTGASIGSAGGMEIVKKGSQLLILCNYQNVAVTGYLLANLAPPVPSGTWTEQPTGLTTALYSVSAVSDDVAWACGTAGKVLRTTNKGVAWTNASGNIPATSPLYNIYAYDANTAICVGDPTGSAIIYATSNAGVNWVSNTYAGAFGDNLWMTSATDAYYIGDPIGGNWHLLKSTNAGVNWATWGTLPTTNTAGTYNNAGWLRGTNVWFPNVGQSAMMYSSNLGVNWVSQTTPLAEYTATCFTSDTRGLAGGSSTSAGLSGTTNGGTTWSPVTQSFVGTASISGIAGASTSWWVALQTTAVWTSSNDGASWTLAYTAPAGAFYHLTKSRTGATLWGVRANGLISRYGQPIIGVNPISTETPVNYSLSQNYPNPFNPTTKINFALPKSGLVTLKVYDVAGKEVATLVNEVKNVGTYSVDFNATNLSSGIYFYKVSINGFSEVKKMMLIK